MIPESAEAVVRRSGVVDYLPLLERLSEAVSAPEAQWVLDIKPAGSVGSVEVQDGPLPVEASVYDQQEYQGDLLIWVTDGRLSGLEFAWITDTAPARWLTPDEISVGA